MHLAVGNRMALSKRVTSTDSGSTRMSLEAMFDGRVGVDATVVTLAETGGWGHRGADHYGKKQLHPEYISQRQNHPD